MDKPSSFTKGLVPPTYTKSEEKRLLFLIENLKTEGGREEAPPRERWTSHPVSPKASCHPLVLKVKKICYFFNSVSSRVERSEHQKEEERCCIKSYKKNIV